MLVLLQPRESRTNSLSEDGFMPEQLIPIFRVTDARATAKWYERLGFELEGEHQFAPNMPIYAF